MISHRGNLCGPDIEKENHPLYIMKAMKLGFDVEVDVWDYNGKIYLGHDKPQHRCDLKFLKNKKLWCHAKNLLALNTMLSNDIHCFWHQQDDFTLTSRGFVWTFPNQNLTSRSICVMPEKCNHNHDDLKIVAGICSDFIKDYTT